MKGQSKIIDTLNELLADEITAINQYIVHAEMCESWGYDKLHDMIEKRAKDEMKHMAMLIQRILFLEYKPVVSKLKNITIGEDVEGMFKYDWNAESDAIKSYNEAIKLCTELGDNGTKTLLENILKDEEAHIDEIEEQLDQIKQMGIANYLAKQ
ncbi:MAG TPA: bacterioferritin [Candidatus Hydrothermia bacterium]|nr:bacterioferritin [Candidatus Hydrothermae bacterium]MDD3649460.1 bacterioferritin [Candidatus Hydrothermia bacterium]MDD5573301.1 bacterioferritin [Candidatus Hydrothermia bacterium]HOK22821.1 bacterioferritin [Candidatus Hydrothermia bacterium]HOL23530.1 bacterioferritin [Candidatus Hydrothermia bacterium]